MAYAGKETSAVRLARCSKTLSKRLECLKKIFLLCFCCQYKHAPLLVYILKIHFHKQMYRITFNSTPLSLYLIGFVSKYNVLTLYVSSLQCSSTCHFIKSHELCLVLDTCVSAGKTWSLKSPLDGKDGEGAAMVERTASCRYPSIPPHQGESVIKKKPVILLRA